VGGVDLEDAHVAGVLSEGGYRLFTGSPVDIDTPVLEPGEEEPLPVAILVEGSRVDGHLLLLMNGGCLFVGPGSVNGMGLVG